MNFILFFLEFNLFSFQFANILAKNASHIVRREDGDMLVDFANCGKGAELTNGVCQCRQRGTFYGAPTLPTDHCFKDGSILDCTLSTEAYPNTVMFVSAESTLIKIQNIFPCPSNNLILGPYLEYWDHQDGFKSFNSSVVKLIPKKLAAGGGTKTTLEVLITASMPAAVQGKVLKINVSICGEQHCLLVKVNGTEEYLRATKSTTSTPSTVATTPIVSSSGPRSTTETPQTSSSVSATTTTTTTQVSPSPHPPRSEKQGGNKNKTNENLIIAVVVTFATILLVFACVLLVIYKMKQRKKDNMGSNHLQPSRPPVALDSDTCQIHGRGNIKKVLSVQNPYVVESKEESAPSVYNPYYEKSSHNVRLDNSNPGYKGTSTKDEETESNAYSYIDPRKLGINDGARFWENNLRDTEDNKKSSNASGYLKLPEESGETKESASHYQELIRD